MAIVVIGGHSRSVGKTSVVAGLIAALPQHHWTAVKITQYGHGICSAMGKACDCACDDHSWAISEEHDRSGDSDTSRFLAAGAARALWVRTEQGRLAEAMPSLQEQICGSRNVIMESNSILKFMRPELYLTVLDPETKDFKNSARELLDRANGVILHTTLPAGSGWQRVLPEKLRERPVFHISPPVYVTPGMVEFVNRKVQNSTPGN